jgi:hypothetical protein
MTGADILRSCVIIPIYTRIVRAVNGDYDLVCISTGRNKTFTKNCAEESLVFFCVFQ